MSRTVAVWAVLLAGALGWATACSDSSGPGSPGDPVPGLIVSSPVVGSAGALSAGTAGSTALVGLVYVSLVPGSVPTGLLARITDQATGLAVTTAVVNGGFDPVGIPASLGDTLFVEITREGEAPLHGFAVVSATRPPVVVRTSPPPGGRDVPLNATVVIVFSEPLDAATVDTGSVKLWRGSTPVPGTVRFADDAHLRAEFHPDSLLAGQTDYQLVLSQGIRDVGGEALGSPVEVPFTTGTTEGQATGLIAFWGGCSWANYDPCNIEVIGVDGAGRRLVVGNAQSPAWSRDGARLAYTNLLTGGIEYVDFSSGQPPRIVTDHRSEYWFSDEHPAWSPDGTKIAFRRAGDEGWGIWVVNADGSNARRLDASSVDGFGGHPTWSPDGTKLAFASWSDQDQQNLILVMNSDGSGSVDTLSAGGWPSWSPDGSQLAFGDISANLVLMNPDGTGRSVLTRGLGWADGPAWSPDGTKIVFTSQQAVAPWDVGLFVINRDGTGLQALLTWTAYDPPIWGPAWGQAAPPLSAAGPAATPRRLGSMQDGR